MMEVLCAAANRKGALAPGSEPRVSRFPDDAGAGIGSVALGSGVRLVARTVISAAAALLIKIRIVGVRIFPTGKSYTRRQEASSTWEASGFSEQADQHPGACGCLTANVSGRNLG